MSTSPVCAQTWAHFFSTCKWHNGTKNSHKETDDQHPTFEICSPLSRAKLGKLQQASLHPSWGSDGSSVDIEFCGSGVGSELLSCLIWVQMWLICLIFPIYKTKEKIVLGWSKMEFPKTSGWMTCVVTSPLWEKWKQNVCSSQKSPDLYPTSCSLNNQNSPNVKVCLQQFLYPWCCLPPLSHPTQTTL